MYNYYIYILIINILHLFFGQASVYIKTLIITSKTTSEFVMDLCQFNISVHHCGPTGFSKCKMVSILNMQMQPTQ